MIFTYAYIEYKTEVFNKFLGPSLKNLDQSKNSLTIISEPNIKPALFWNKVIKESKNDYIIFSHEDVKFPPEMLNLIESTINKVPEFGVLCVVGKNLYNKNIGALRSNLYTLEFCDPCFFVINKNNNLYFDEITFDDFHFVAEDYCINVSQKLNKKTYTILVNWGSEFIHGSDTSKSVKYQWGAYPKYKSKFKKKWNYLENINKF